MEKIDLSIIVLAYKSEQQVMKYCQNILSSLEDLSLNIELVVVNNYDRHKVFIDMGVLTYLHYFVVREVSKQKQGGLGWDIHSGMKNCLGHYLCILDGDGQVASSSVRDAYLLISGEGLDVVKAKRVERNDGRLRLFVSRVYEWVFHLVFPETSHIQDINGKPKMLLRSSWNKMKLDNEEWFFDAEFTLETCRLKLAFKEFPVVSYQNLHRKSLVNVFVVLNFLYNIGKYKLLKKSI